MNFSTMEIARLCTNHKIYPAVDFDNVFVSHDGIICELNEEGLFIPIKPIKYTKKKNIPIFKLIDYLGNEIEIDGARIMMSTFYGKFPAKIKLQMNYEDCTYNEMRYMIESYEVISDNIIIINDIIFKNIPNQDNTPTRYYITKDGIVWNDISRTFIKYYHNYAMYIQVSLTSTKITQRLNRLVYITWEDPNLYNEIQINHKNGRKNNNSLSNLEPADQFENMQHSRDNKLRYYVWEPEDIHKICSLLESNKYKPQEIAKIMGKNDERGYNQVVSTIKEIKQGTSWLQISSQYNLSNYKNTLHKSIFPDEIIHAVCKASIAGRTRPQIAKEYGMTAQYVKEIQIGTRRSDISSQYDLSNIVYTYKARTPDDIHAMCQYIMAGHSILDTANIFNVNKSVVMDTIRRRYHKDITSQYNFESIFPHLEYRSPYIFNSSKKAA